MKPAQSHTTNPLPVPPVCVTINVSPKATPQTSTPQNPQPSLEVESLEQAITLLHEALERVVETAQFANQLLNKIKASTTQIATRSPEHRPANRPLLEIQTLGGLEVRLDAKPVRFPFAKCGELLVWLALHGPATRDQICDVLWNGYVTQSNLEYFRVIVRRIRAALANAGNLGPTCWCLSAACTGSQINSRFAWMRSNWPPH